MSFWRALKKKFGKVSTVAPAAAVTGNIALPARVANEAIERILLLKLDHIGDLLVALRAMEMLRTTWPKAEITLLCGPWNVGFARTCGLVDHVVAFDFFAASAAEAVDNDELDHARVVALGLGTFDLAVDLRHDGDSRRVLDHVETRHRAGYHAHGLKHRLDLELPLVELYHGAAPPPLHAETRLTLLAAAVVAAFDRPLIHPARRLIGAGGPRPFGDRPYAVFATGAGSPLRQWPADRLAELIGRVIARFGFGVVLAGSPKECEMNAAIAARLPGPDLIDRTGTPLDEIPATIAGAALFVGYDTGTTHLAAMLDVPTVCIYGGISDPRVWQPVGRDVTIVHAVVDCCYCHQSRPAACPNDRVCMTSITVDDVFAAIAARLDLCH